MVLKACIDCHLRTRVEIIMGAMEIKLFSHKIIEKLGPGTNNKKNNLALKNLNPNLCCQKKNSE